MKNLPLLSRLKPLCQSTGILAVLMGFSFVSGCGGGSAIGSIIGVDKGRTPDEFAVVRRAPLTLPPNYDLRPPDPTGQRTQDVAARETARQTVFGESAAENAAGNTALANNANTATTSQQISSSQADQLILAKTGANKADSQIRQQIEQESSALVKVDSGFLNDLMFWKKNKKPTTSIVDANAEAKRIQENNALGQEVTDGQTPTIRRANDRPFFDWF